MATPATSVAGSRRPPFSTTWATPCLLFDYRGYGRSTGRPSEEGLALDALWRLRCSACGEEREDLDLDTPPRCACGGRRRPGVVWFGEALPAEAIESATDAATGADIVLVAGTSSMVYPAAVLPEIARRAGAHTVEINPERTGLSDRVDERIAGPSGAVFPALLDAAGFGDAR